LFSVFLGVGEPAAEYRQGLRLNFEKRDAGAKMGLHINDFGLGVEEFFTGKNFDEYESALRKGIHHIEVAAVQAELADASGDAHVGLLFDEFGAGDEGITGRAALFFPQADGPLK